MKFLINLTLTLTYFFLLTFFILLIPFNFIFNQQNIQNTLHSLKLYERVVTIAQTQWKDNIIATQPQYSLFSQTITEHADQIIDQQWLEQTGNMLIEHIFLFFDTNQPIEDIRIDITPIKTKFINILSETDIKEDIPFIKDQIPDWIPLSLLLNTDINQVNLVLNQIKDIYLSIPIIVITLGFLIFAVVLVFFWITPKRSTITWLSWSNLAIGIAFLLFSFIFRFVILNPRFLQTHIAESESLWKILGLIVSTSFVEQMITIWSWISLGIFSLGLVGVLTIRLTTDSQTDNEEE